MPLSGIDLLSLQDRLRLSKDDRGRVRVFDPVRRINVLTTPEEIVRQLWILHFTRVMGLHPKFIAVERSFNFNSLMKRFDLILFGSNAAPKLLAEFKSPGVPITQAVFDQVAEYNMKWEVPFALVSNGREHYCFSIDHHLQTFRWHSELPV